MVRSRLVGLALTASTAAAPDAGAQVTPDLETISYGETVSDYLTYGDLTLQDSSYFKPYVFTGAQGDTITIWLSSEDFNANLLLTDSLDVVIANDDNGSGGCDAHLSMTLPHAGRYVIYANTAGAGEFGQFQLTLQRGAQQPESDAPCTGFVGHVGTIALGDSVTGALGPSTRMLRDSQYFHVWLLENPRAAPFTVDAEAAEFDAALVLVRGIEDVVIVNDDGAGGCNPRVPFTPADRRPYRLVVLSRTAGVGGTYRMRVTEGLTPVTDQPPCDLGGEE